MRTTLDLPDEVLRRAKIAAEGRGTTLRDLVAAEVVRELATPRSKPTKPKRTGFSRLLLPRSRDPRTHER